MMLAAQRRDLEPNAVYPKGWEETRRGLDILFKNATVMEAVVCSKMTKNKGVSTYFVRGDFDARFGRLFDANQHDKLHNDGGMRLFVDKDVVLLRDEKVSVVVYDFEFPLQKGHDGWEKRVKGEEGANVFRYKVRIDVVLATPAARR